MPLTVKLDPQQASSMLKLVHTQYYILVYAATTPASHFCLALLLLIAAGARHMLKSHCFRLVLMCMRLLLDSCQTTATCVIYNLLSSVYTVATASDINIRYRYIDVRVTVVSMPETKHQMRHASNASRANWDALLLLSDINV